MSGPDFSAATLPATNGSKKRGVDETQDTSSSPRRSKRTRRSINTENATDSPTLEAESPKKLSKRVVVNAKASTSRNEDKSASIKVEQEDISETVESKKSSRSVKKQTTRAVKGTVALKEEDIEIKETEIQPKKAAKKRVSEEEKTVEMAAPLAARTRGLKMFVGAHVSAAKGVQNSVINSVHIGGNAFALFLKSQRKWDNPPLQDDHREQFLKFCLEHEYDAAKYILPHGSYLVNLAQEDKAKAKQAYDSFVDDLKRCEKLGIKLYNFHPGAVGQSTLESAISRLAQALTKALSATSTVTPVLETMCGHGTTIGGPLSEIGSIISQIPEEFHSRIGVCIDTCHSFAYGYDLVSPEGFKSFMQEFDDKIGLKFLRALHLNDSKAPRGSRRDLHANIGTGFLGLRAFHNVMNEERLQGLPMILETPIDRPNPASGKSQADEGKESDDSEQDSDAPKTKKKNQPKKKPAGKAPPTIEDKSVWAREIKLLESLIGMDPESAEFRSLEKQLSEAGRAERAKQKELYERKLETEAKKKQKELEKGQRSLADMFQKGKKGTKKGKKSDDTLEPSSAED